MKGEVGVTLEQCGPCRSRKPHWAEALGEIKERKEETPRRELASRISFRRETIISYKASPRAQGLGPFVLPEPRILPEAHRTRRLASRRRVVTLTMSMRWRWNQGLD